MNVINISKIVSLSDLKDLSIQEVGRGSCTIGKYEFTFEHVEFNHTVRHPDGNSLAPSCHFRTLLFSEGCTGISDLETAKRYLGPVKNKLSLKTLRSQHSHG